MKSVRAEQPAGGAERSGLIARELVVAGMLTSGLIHLLLTPEHLQDALLLGLGFLLVAVLQCALGVALLRLAAPALWQPSVVLLAFSLSAYVISRTLGFPFGHDHRSDPIGVLDIVAKASELLALGGLLPSIHSTTRHWPRGRSPQMAPFNRYAYLLALVLVGAVAALYLAHGHGASEEQGNGAGKALQPRLAAGPSILRDASFTRIGSAPGPMPGPPRLSSVANGLDGG